jgi:hypothetical protein
VSRVNQFGESAHRLAAQFAQAHRRAAEVKARIDRLRAVATECDAAIEAARAALCDAVGSTHPPVYAIGSLGIKVYPAHVESFLLAGNLDVQAEAAPNIVVELADEDTLPARAISVTGVPRVRSVQA